MNIQKFVEKWLAVSNAFDTENYLKTYHSNAAIHDPSVGKIFEGHDGIRSYFENYFVGYKTQTYLMDLTIVSSNEVHLNLEFSGTFSEGKIRGIFELVLDESKIIAAKAELL